MVKTNIITWKDSSTASWDMLKSVYDAAWWEKQVAFNDELNSENIDMNLLWTPDNTTLQDWSNSIQSAWVISWWDITNWWSWTIDISEVNWIIKTTNSIIWENLFFKLAWATWLALTDNTTNYISVDYNAWTPQFVVWTTNPANWHTIFNLWKVYREWTWLDIINSWLNIDDFSKRVQQHHLEENQLHFVSWAVVWETWTRNISITAWIMYAWLNRILTDGIDTSWADDFEYYYYNGTAWVESDETQIDNLQYNDITSWLETLSNNRYWVHWVFKGTNWTTYVVYWQDSYTLINAQAAQPPAILPNHVSWFGVLRAKIIIAKSWTVFTEIESVDDVAFSAQTAWSHAELSALLLAWLGVTYWHIDDQAQTIAWEKTFSDETTFESNIVVDWTVDWRNVSTDWTKLDTIEEWAEENTINSDTTGVTGADQVTNVISLTQAEYDAITTPNTSTLYIITDA